MSMRISSLRPLLLISHALRFIDDSATGRDERVADISLLFMITLLP